MIKTPTIPQQIKALLLHLINNPGMPGQLKTLHDLALYDSGEALLGPNEKEALRNAQELAERIKKLGKKERDFLRSLI